MYGQVLCRDALARIRHGQQGFRPIRPHREGDCAVGRGVLDRVAEQVEQELLEPVGIGIDAHRVKAPQPDRRAVGGQHLGLLEDLQHQGIQLQGLLEHGQLARVGLGQQEQVAHQAGHALALPGDGVQGILVVVALDQVDAALDHGQRGAQLVGDVCHEAPLGLKQGFQAAQGGVEDAHQAAQLVGGPL